MKLKTKFWISRGCVDGIIFVFFLKKLNSRNEQNVGKKHREVKKSKNASKFDIFLIFFF